MVLDSDLAALYDVQTKVLNQAIQRNLDSFPPDFRFQLTESEMDSFRSQIVTSNVGQDGRRYRGRSKADFIAKCGDSLRELEETAYWLELLVDGEIVPAATLQPRRNECDELTAIFVTIIKRARDTA